MKFRYNDFTCDVEIFKNLNNIVARFYDKSLVQDSDQMQNLVIVNQGFGYICLKFVGGNGILSGFLDENIFTSDEIVRQAIEFVENLSPLSAKAYIPHYVCRVKFTSFVEYNGEY